MRLLRKRHRRDQAIMSPLKSYARIARFLLFTCIKNTRFNICNSTNIIDGRHHRAKLSMSNTEDKTVIKQTMEIIRR